jgi:hypothetical protein
VLQLGQRNRAQVLVNSVLYGTKSIEKKYSFIFVLHGVVIPNPRPVIPLI